MPGPTPKAVRLQILQLRREGWSVSQIAQRTGVLDRTVRRLVRSLTDSPGGVDPAYAPTNRRGCSLPADKRQWVLDLTQAHPTWGAEYLRVRLIEMDSHTPWPSARTLQRWMAAVRNPAERSTRQRQGPHPRAAGVHDTWQIDAVDQLALATKELVSWLRVTDECSGAFLHTRVFSLRLLQPSGTAVGPDGVGRLFCPLGSSAGDSRR